MIRLCLTRHGWSDEPEEEIIGPLEVAAFEDDGVHDGMAGELLLVPEPNAPGWWFIGDDTSASWRLQIMTDPASISPNA